MQLRDRTRTPAEPPADAWFRVHPAVAVIVAGALFAAVATARFLVAGKEDPISELYALPIALLALAFGLRAGLAAGGLAMSLIVAWAAFTDVELSPVGWATRLVPLLLLGTLLGAASDRIRLARAREVHLAAVTALQREAAEVNDCVVQKLTVAKWLLESNEVERGLEAVTETMLTAQALVSQMLGSGSPLPGDLRRSRSSAAAELASAVSAPRPASP
ncbi:MAG TPA: hypothetical protein VM345_08535 [Acidimicrobiales bacterium]|jgi:hypothetical protein|nr:hypothetical protein [Acidimicrobiales bacterium]